MLVSAVVSTYNRAHLVGRTIESIQAQTYNDIEVIVVDDESSDNTAEVVRGYAAKSRVPIKYVWKKNGGCASARNEGILHASGELFAFIDDDDQWLPDAIKSMADTLEKTGADFVYTPTVEVTDDGERRTALPVAAGEPERLAWEHFFRTHVRVCAVMYRKKVIDRLRFDDTIRYNEDSYLLEQAALQFKAAYSPVPTAVVFQHAGNISRNRSELDRTVLECTARILNEFPEFRESLGALADERLDRLGAVVAESLVREGRYAEARKFGSGGASKYLPVQVRLAILTGSGLPVRLRILAGRIKARLKTIAGISNAGGTR